MLRLGGAYLQVSLEITKSGAKVLMRCKKYSPITGHGFRVPKGCTRQAKIGLHTGIDTQLKKVPQVLRIPHLWSPQLKPRDPGTGPSQG